MGGRKIFTFDRDNIQTLAATIGVVSALLYVWGYVAERVHWNLYGHIIVPADHIEFLYRGGNLLMSTLASFLLYLILALDNLYRFLLVSAIIISLILADRFHNIPTRLRALTRWRFGHPLLYVAFFFLLILLGYELRNIPSIPENLLFQEALQLDRASITGYFNKYVGVTGLWLIFIIIGRRVAGRVKETSEPEAEAPADVLSEQEESAGWLDDLQSQWAFFFVNRRAWGASATRARGAEEASASEARPQSRIDDLAAKALPTLLAFGTALTLLLLCFLPAAYGRFQYPHVYPLVQVSLAKDVPAGLESNFTGGAVQALLFETSEDYVLYNRRQSPSVLKLRKSDVSLVTVRRPCDITMPDCLVSPPP